MRISKTHIFLILGLLVFIPIGTFLLTRNNNIVLPSRESKIPKDLVKIIPSMDANPPKSYSELYYDPIPIKGKVNTAGGEDSPFILPDGNTLYFFFTPDVRVPAEKQVIDQVTGIYVSKKVGDVWQEPERIILQDIGKLALDGAEFVQNNTMYFCSAREGYTGIHWFKAQYINGKWVNWVNADQELKYAEYSTGELHISSDGRELYFHSTRSDGLGGYDIWVSKKVNEIWDYPVNLSLINSAGNEGWPCITENGKELWFSKDYGIWRSERINGEWTKPTQMFSPLAGEPSVDNNGNVYFTHHFYKNNTMLEADIYVSFKKP